MQSRRFPEEEYQSRLGELRRLMAERGLDACLVSAPENIYYLCGLDNQGYFAYQLLAVPLEGEPILITRAMERATIRDLVPGVRHVGYADGAPPLPPAERSGAELAYAARDAAGEVAGLQPWSMSYGVTTRESAKAEVPVPVQATIAALAEAGLSEQRLALEQGGSFLPYRIADGIMKGLPRATWSDASGLVEQCRLVQSPRELACTRAAARVSESMMLAAIAAAGPGIHEREVMSAIYDAMFRHGGTYPGFVPLVRNARTIEHEHSTWGEGRLQSRDLLFLEVAGCVRRYHAPIGRLVFIGKAPSRTHKVHALCLEAAERAAEAIAPGARACDVYQAWQACLDRAGLAHYSRHHCGYSVGIGFPPSWVGSGPPVGLRPGATFELRPGMVFHLMSWLLRTGRGDSFVSDTVVVTESGCELLTGVSRDVTVR